MDAVIREFGQQVMILMVGISLITGAGCLLLLLWYNLRKLGDWLLNRLFGLTASEEEEG